MARGGGFQILGTLELFVENYTLDLIGQAPYLLGCCRGLKPFEQGHESLV